MGRTWMLSTGRREKGVQGLLAFEDIHGHPTAQTQPPLQVLMSLGRLFCGAEGQVSVAMSVQGIGFSVPEPSGSWAAQTPAVHVASLLFDTRSSELTFIWGIGQPALKKDLEQADEGSLRF